MAAGWEYQGATASVDLDGLRVRIERDVRRALETVAVAFGHVFASPEADLIADIDRVVAYNGRFIPHDIDADEREGHRLARRRRRVPRSQAREHAARHWTASLRSFRRS